MIKVFFTQEEIKQLYQALNHIPLEIYSECDTPDDLDKELLSGIEKLKQETENDSWASISKSKRIFTIKCRR